MKNYIRLLIIIVIIQSCTKPSKDNNTPTSSLVTKFIAQDGAHHNYEVDSFQYDNNQHLIKLLQWNFDSTVAPISKDSSETDFIYSGTSETPSSYILNYLDISNTKENHVLFYDANNRISRDTVLNSNLGQVTCYRYFDSLIECITYFNNQNGGRFNNDQEIYHISGGNIYKSDFNEFQDDTLYNASYFNFKYSNIANPLYYQNISQGLGAWIRYNIGCDIISKNIFSWYHYIDPMMSPELPYDFIWTTDGNGRISSGSSTDNSYSFKFSYK